MTLVYVSHSHPPRDAPLSNIGGMQRVAQELHTALKSRDDLELDAILLYSSWKWIHFKILPFLIATCFNLRSRISEGRIDTILFSSMVSAVLCIPLSKRMRAAGVRSAAIVHGLDVTTPNPVYQRLVRLVFQRVDLVLPVSHATAAACVSRGLCENRVRVIHNGVSTTRFDPEPPAHPDRKALFTQLNVPLCALSRDDFLLCSVGRHVRRKGYQWFINSVMPLLTENVHYWIAGEGPEHQAIQAAVRDTGLENRVRLLGRLSETELTALYRGADLFVMPNIRVENDMEGFGIVMLEAGINGLPSIAAKLEGIEEVICEGSNGHFVHSGDAAGFADRITDYVSGSRDLEAARRSAFKYTRDEFSWETIAGEVVEALSLAV